MKRVLLTLVGLFLAAPAIVLAHGIGQRIDLPIPLDLYIVGGAAVVALSFLAVWFLPPRFLERVFETTHIHVRALDWFVHARVVRTLQVLSAAFFILLLYAGFFGTTNAEENIAPTTLWIMFAVGVTFFSAFAGNIWSALNPVATLYAACSFLLRRMKVATRVIEWRHSWGVWPAVVGFLLFRWIENVYPASSEPRVVATLLLLYVVYSFVGMTIFGVRTWLTHADPFAVFFTFLSKFSLFTTQRVNGVTNVFLRVPASGLLHERPTFSEVIFVLAMLSSVTADGFFDTPTMLRALDTLQAFGIAEMASKSAALVLLLGVFTLIYLGMAALVHVMLPRVISTAKFASLFVFSLLPISVAYEFAHYASLLVLEGQRFLALLSDPLGRGWNIFKTAQLTIDYTLVNIKMLWNIQIGAIVLGHVIAVFVAHAIAERVFPNRDHVLASQYPMLIVMLFYTMFSLWIIAQPVVA